MKQPAEACGIDASTRPGENASAVEAQDQMEAATAATRHKLVTVTRTLTDETGESSTEKKAIEGGPTEVLELKAELGIAPDAALWVVQKSGKKKQLADHERHNVKEGDHYEALVRGGVS